MNLLTDKKIGVVGVAGSTYVPSIPAPWWISNFADMSVYLRTHFIQHTSRGLEKNLLPSEIAPDKKLFEVVLLDGVWFCCRKKVWDEMKFDEKYGGFHFYDLDFSMAVYSKGYHNYVTHEVLLEHFSKGHLDNQWMESAFLFQKKWKALLPVAIGSIDKHARKLINREALRNILTITLDRSPTGMNWFGYWLKYFLTEPFKLLTYSLLKSRIW